MLDVAETENRSDDQSNRTDRNKLSIKVDVGSRNFILIADLDSLEQIFRAIAKYCFSVGSGGSLSAEWTKLEELIDKGCFSRTNYDREESDERVVTDEIKSAAEEGVKYIQQNLEDFLTQTIQSLICEAAIKVMIERTKRKFSKFKLAKNGAFKILKINFAKAVKERLKIIDDSRQDPYWTDAKKLELLEFYNKYHALVKEASKVYEAEKAHSRWQEIIKIKFSELPDEIMNKFPLLTGIDGQPTALALEYTSQKFNYYSTSYLVKMLAQARDLSEPSA